MLRGKPAPPEANNGTTRTIGAAQKVVPIDVFRNKLGIHIYYIILNIIRRNIGVILNKVQIFRSRFPLIFFRRKKNQQLKTRNF